MIEELRQLGGEILVDWAVSKEKQKVDDVQGAKERKVTGHGKKNSTGKRPSGK